MARDNELAEAPLLQCASSTGSSIGERFERGLMREVMAEVKKDQDGARKRRADVVPPDEAGSEQQPAVAECRVVTWAECIELSGGEANCTLCNMLIKLDGDFTGRQPPPLVQCPGCKEVLLNTGAAPPKDPRTFIWKFLHPMQTLVWTLIIFIISYGIGWTIPHATDDPSHRRAHWSFACWLSINVVVQFFNTCRLHPGHPRAIRRDHCDGPQPFCPKSNYAKPYRSHFCSVSQTLVLKMDHFCTFANNTIGHNNHRCFVLFVGFIFVSALYAFGMALVPFRAMGWKQWSGQAVKAFMARHGMAAIGSAGNPHAYAADVVARRQQTGGGLGLMNADGTVNLGLLVTVPYDMVADLLILMIGAMTSCLVGSLLYFQLKIAARGFTTIEWAGREHGEPSPWDRGSAKANLEELFGPLNCWTVLTTVLLPFRPEHVGDGCHYKPNPNPRAEAREDAKAV